MWQGTWGRRSGEGAGQVRQAATGALGQNARCKNAKCKMQKRKTQGARGETHLLVLLREHLGHARLVNLVERDLQAGRQWQAGSGSEHQSALSAR